VNAGPLVVVARHGTLQGQSGTIHSATSGLDVRFRFSVAADRCVWTEKQGRVCEYVGWLHEELENLQARCATMMDADVRFRFSVAADRCVWTEKKGRVCEYVGWLHELVQGIRLWRGQDVIVRYLCTFA
jgi:hypothetical protein